MHRSQSSPSRQAAEAVCACDKGSQSDRTNPVHDPHADRVHVGGSPHQTYALANDDVKALSSGYIEFGNVANHPMVLRRLPHLAEVNENDLYKSDEQIKNCLLYTSPSPRDA